MWDLIVSVPDHCLSFYFIDSSKSGQNNGADIAEREEESEEEERLKKEKRKQRRGKRKDKEK